ncbi:hypothetical protein ACFL35_01495 [Candidatus Riflebacteria bacterium]
MKNQLLEEYLIHFEFITSLSFSCLAGISSIKRDGLSGRGSIMTNTGTGIMLIIFRTGPYLMEILW